MCLPPSTGKPSQKRFRLFSRRFDIRIGQGINPSLNIHFPFFQAQSVHVQILSLDEQHPQFRLEQNLRHIKRRTVANEACDAGRVMVNGKPAKASVNVKVGDIIEIGFGTKTVKVRVLDLQDTTKKEEAKDLFEYVS